MGCAATCAIRRNSETEADEVPDAIVAGSIRGVWSAVDIVFWGMRRLFCFLFFSSLSFFSSAQVDESGVCDSLASFLEVISTLKC